MRDLGLCAGRNIAVHSNLLTFGRIEGGAATVLSALRAVVGKDATIAVPTYTLNLGSDTPYDPKRTPSYATGVFSEYVRRLPASRRSSSPMHSHAAIGPLAEQVAAGDPSRSFGKSSCFDVMTGYDFDLLLLGCSYQEGATFVHHVEAEIGVPYRQWLDLPRLVQSPDGEILRLTCRYYGHTDGHQYDNNLITVQQEMERRGLQSSAATHYARSYLMRLVNLEACVTEMLARDPYILVTRMEHDSAQ